MLVGVLPRAHGVLTVMSVGAMICCRWGKRCAGRGSGGASAEFGGRCWPTGLSGRHWLPRGVHVTYLIFAPHPRLVTMGGRNRRL